MVVPFRRETDELFTAPSNHHKLQADESLRAGDLAEDIAHAAYNRDVSELGRREQAVCRYLATHALRMTHDNWKVAALAEAMQAVQRWMRDDAGSAFRHLSDAHHEAIAAFLVPVVVTAYHGITEGTIPLEPARYLGIVEGEGI